VTAARPLLSIVIPSFNQGSYIRETLDSTFSQDYRPIEVLVLDGGSTDGTVDVLRSYDAPELQWWSERDRGVVDAVNKGLVRVQGEIVAIQSSDDLYVAGTFEAAVAALNAEPEVALVYGDVDYIDAQSRVTSRTALPPFNLSEYIGKRSFIPQPAAFFRASAMREAGPWREDISYAADAEFYLRIAMKHGVRKLDRILARYRYHQAQRDKAGTRIPSDWAKAVGPWTHDADRVLRRSARSGVWMVRHHYTAERAWLRRTYLVWRMVASDPSLLRHPAVRVQELIPFGYPLRRLLSRLKQSLGFRPR
jgi:glycosyltransferase involved in cell wall biosynthesis